MPQDRLLLVEDNYDLACSLAETLAGAGYDVDYASDGLHALRLAADAAPPFDAVLLDIGLPRMNGLEVCRRLRATGFTAPVLMLTALGAPDDIVEGLERGSDDYIVKPVDSKVLVARLRAAIRRHLNVPGEQGMLRVGHLALDTARHQATVGAAQPVALTPLQSRLLEQLLRHAPRVLSGAELRDALWRDGDTPGNDNLRAHIYQLRKLIDKPHGANLIRTQGRQGYYLDFGP